ncbi:hypothetical protein H9X88_13190 [Aeromonas hydrophila]|uniref:hypothetical protein n=1 Tax=Aeromonas hydrophila TaxID=644 RepID=UPI001915DC16|nr:hypothetical protein [Aeromonas hydrophila]MBQ4677209.1 hypothetical protein [Aeromonas hydrophila]MBW3813813.1 hypothetical protein [Aeromonas hydrophila]MCF7679042.1 hypothetical protein [Aeromonas hydrophila]MCF7692090.1 hypothetical protein [Aeromonas hydrophila]MCF7772890.1 hypothetical protein [Aeromonas hydrophila]
MSEHLALYALPAMGKIELAWPKRKKPSDIAGQSSGDIKGRRHKNPEKVLPL